MEKILKKHKLILILMHGSQVTGKTHNKSDYDIAVLPRGEIDMLDLIYDLGKVLKTDMVDLVNLKNADPLLLFGVTKSSKLLAGKYKDYVNFNLRAFHRYNDYLPYFKDEEEHLRMKIKNYVSL